MGPPAPRTVAGCHSDFVAESRATNLHTGERGFAAFFGVRYNYQPV